MAYVGYALCFAGGALLAADAPASRIAGFGVTIAGFALILM